MKSFPEMISRALSMGPKRIAISGSADLPLRDALGKARGMGLGEAECFENPADAVAAVREGRADVLMKGSSSTSEVIKAALDPVKGLRSGHLLSHIAIMEGPHGFVLVSDGGIVINPTLEQKVEIIKNAVAVTKVLEMGRPKVALLTAYERVNPKMPETVDADLISKMQWNDCDVQGPMAADDAVDMDMARLKGLEGPVAGQANVLIVPSVLAGNLFCKGIICFSKTRWAGMVAGVNKPFVLLSRSDTMETRLNNIAMGVVISEDRRWVRTD
jgi:phosphate butyryltransferase